MSTFSGVWISNITLIASKHLARLTGVLASLLSLIPESAEAEENTRASQSRRKEACEASCHFQ